ncbi:hypothetical protein H0H93_010840, partial [Arthromyces matolae]
MSSPSAEAAAALAQAQKEGQAVILWTVGMFCIFGWDYFMNLPKEIKYIWKRQITFPSILYIANRYYGLLQFAVCIWLLTTPITNAVSVDTCNRIFRWQPVGALISTLLSQLIMGHRVFALYGQSFAIIGILGVVMAAEFAVHAYTLTNVFPAQSPAPGVVIPCIAIGPTNWLVAFWAIPLLFDSITFTLTLYKSIQHWRNEVKSATLSLLFRDGLVYFAAIFSMNLINVVLFVTQDETLQAINLPATLMLNIIMSCRLILNLRKPRNILPSNNSDSSKRAPLWKAPQVVVVTGTGAQGRAVSQAFHNSGLWQVRVLTRNPDGKVATDFKSRGMEVVKANFEDKASLLRAFEGAYAVFSVTIPPWHKNYTNTLEECDQGKLQADAAKESNVQLFLFSTLPYVGPDYMGMGGVELYD